MGDLKAEGRVAIYITKEILGVEGEDELEKVSNTTPIPEQAHDILDLVESSGYIRDVKARVYLHAWHNLQEKVLDEKTGWGKEELKKRMDKLLIEVMEAYL
jgi:hypothetical protein